jgi:transcriptional regulator with XRE-family HTH domain
MATKKTFAYPSGRDASVRDKLRARLSELMRARKMDHVDLAHQLGDQSSARLRGYVTGKGFPTPDKAAQLAKFFGVTVENLFRPKGAFVEIPLRRAGYTRKGAAKAPALPPPPLPDKAQPLVLTFAVYKGDSRFANIYVRGTVLLDHALNIVAMLNQDKLR